LLDLFGRFATAEEVVEAVAAPPLCLAFGFGAGAGSSAASPPLSSPFGLTPPGFRSFWHFGAAVRRVLASALVRRLRVAALRSGYDAAG